MIDYRSQIHGILQNVINIRYAEIAEHVSMETKNVVQGGPFAGMLMPSEVSWGQGDLIPKLLGCYEQELHPAIEKAILRNPAVVFNVGCAEGYYAVGLARRLPEATVGAFDTGGISVVLKAAAANDVGRRFTAGGEFKSSRINDWNVTPYRSLVVMDIEGDECRMFDHEEDYKYSDLIIECHDFKNQLITPILIQRLQETHDIQIVSQTGRDHTAYHLLNNYVDFDRALALCEFRPVPMHFLVAWSKAEV